MASKSKRRRALVESSSESEDEDTFTFKYGEDLYIDDEDRKHLESLSEVEQLTILSERADERKEALDIWKMQQRQKAAEKKAAKKAAEPDRKTRRRDTTSTKKTQREKALEAIRAKRKKAKAREAEQKDEDYEEPEEPVADDDDDDDYKGDDIGGASPDPVYQSSDDEEYVASRTADLADIQRIRLSRHKLELWCHEPYFADTVVGCFVRIGIGKNEHGSYMYRAAQIVNVEERNSAYSLGKTRTKKALRLKHGVDERQFRMEFVSNSPITESEYRKWKEQMEDNNLTLIKMDHVEMKAKDLENAMNFEHDHHTINEVISEKRKAGAGSANAALVRAELYRKQTSIKIEIRDIEASAANIETEDELQTAREKIEKLREELERTNEEIETVKNNAEENYKHRAEHFLSIEEINLRNTALNRIKAQAMAADGSSRNQKEKTLYDRRQMNPSIVTFKKKEPEPLKIETPQDTPQKPGSVSDLKSPLSPLSPDTKLPSLDINIDIDIPENISGSAPAAITSSKPSSKTKVSSRRGLSLREYKLANGLL